MENIMIVNNENFVELTKDGVVALVDFWADWCGPCKMLLPIIAELGNEFKGKAIIAKVNVDENPELSEKFAVMNIPTVVVLKNGIEVERSVGFRQKQQLAQLIEKHLK